MQKIKYLTALCAVLFFISCGGPTNNTKQTTEETYEIGKIKTPLGEMLVWLYDQTPNHKQNFIDLANQHYFDTLTFNRVIDGFVIQGGCPDTPEGFTNSPYLIDPEFVDTLQHVYGALANGHDYNDARQSAGCQIFIVHNKEGIPRLDSNFTVFGQVVVGLDILNAIATTPTDTTDAPITPVTMQVTIEDMTKTELSTAGYKM